MAIHGTRRGRLLYTALPEHPILRTLGVGALVLVVAGCDRGADIVGAWTFNFDEPYGYDVRESNSCEGPYTASGVKSLKTALFVSPDFDVTYEYAESSNGVFSFANEDCPPEEYSYLLELSFEGIVLRDPDGWTLVGKGLLAGETPEYGFSLEHFCQLEDEILTCEGLGAQVWVFERVEDGPE